MQEYRTALNIPDAKLIVISMIETEFGIWDSADSNMLEIYGLDSSVPILIREFISGSLSWIIRNTIVNCQKFLRFFYNDFTLYITYSSLCCAIMKVTVVWFIFPYPNFTYIFIIHIFNASVLHFSYTIVKFHYFGLL